MILLAGARADAQNDGFAQSLHAFVSIGTADVYRGLLRQRDDVAVQAAARWSINEAFFIGTHVSPVEFAERDGSISNGFELDYYIGWHRPLGENNALQLRVGRHTYPGTGDSVEYDYDEISVGLHLGPNWSLSIGLNRFALAIADSGGAAEINWRAAAGQRFEFSAALGGVRYFDSPVPGYGYWDAGASAPLGPVTADLRYHYTPQNALWFGRKPAHGMWVLSLTAGW